MVGLSGGPDSVCLLHVLGRLSTELGFTLSAVHVNHGLRGEDANADQRWVEALCQDWKIPLKCFFFDVPALARDWGISAEEAGRRVRYQAFEEVRAIYAGLRLHCCTGMDGTGAIVQSEPGIDCTVKIAIGQNKNDQAETLLMRILRGTGTDGLAGIEAVRDGVFLRPLLSVTRAEIEEYCKEHHLEPRIDQTNLETMYHRNRIRLDLLPKLIQEYNPNLLDTLSRMAKNSAEDREYLRGAARDLIQTYRTEQNQLPLSVMQGLAPAIAKRVIALLLADLGLNQDIATVHLEQAIALIRRGEPGTVAEFPRHFLMRIRYGQVEFDQQSPQRVEPFQYPLEPEGQTLLPEANAVILSSLQAGTLMDPDAMLDYDKILSTGLPLQIRNRRSGDWFRPKGFEGRKSLKKLLIDRKVPREERDLIPILFLGQEALWIPGQGVSGAYQAKEDALRILHLKFTRLSPGNHSKS